MNEVVVGGTPTGLGKEKVCFVTVGATAPFDGLVRAVLSPPFLRALSRAGYTTLRVQHGKEGKLNLFQDLSTAPETVELSNGLHMSISGFDFNTDGLDDEFQNAKGLQARGSKDAVTGEGCVISHAGSMFHSFL